MNNLSAPADHNSATEQSTWAARLLELLDNFRNDFKQCAIDNDSVSAALDSVTQNLSNLHRLEVHHYSKLSTTGAGTPAAYAEKCKETGRQVEAFMKAMTALDEALYESTQEGLSFDIVRKCAGVMKPYSSDYQVALRQCLVYPLPPNHINKQDSTIFMEIFREEDDDPEMGDSQLAFSINSAVETSHSSVTESAVKNHFEKHYKDDKVKVASAVESALGTLQRRLQTLKASDTQASERKRLVGAGDLKFKEKNDTAHAQLVGPALVVLLRDQQAGRNDDSSSTFFLPPGEHLDGLTLELSRGDHTRSADEGPGYAPSVANSSLQTMLDRVSTANGQSVEDVIPSILRSLAEGTEGLGKLTQSFKDPSVGYEYDSSNV